MSVFFLFHYSRTGKLLTKYKMEIVRQEVSLTGDEPTDRQTDTHILSEMEIECSKKSRQREMNQQTDGQTDGCKHTFRDGDRVRREVSSTGDEPTTATC